MPVAVSRAYVRCWTSAKSVKRGICPCGHAVIEEHVPLGKMYRVDMNSLHRGGLICGGCGRNMACDIIYADDPLYPGWIVADVFEFQRN